MKTEIVKVNDIQIECPFENNQHYVAIKPVCEALGIDHQKQFERIKSDGMLSQLYTDTVYSSAQDGKQRKMICLPLKYVFGWIFSIEDSKINERAKPAFLKYKQECYSALYDHFYMRSALYEKKEKLIAQKKTQILQEELNKQEIVENIKKLKQDLVTIQETPVGQLTLGFENNE